MTYGQPTPNEAIEQINSEGAERLEFEAKRLREQVIDFSYQATKAYAAQDQDVLRALQPGEEAEFYTLDESFAAPLEDGHFERTLSLKLRRRQDPYHQSMDQLLVYVPIPENFDLEISYIETEFERPKRMYVERVNEVGVTARHVITPEGIAAYVAAIDSGEDVTDVDVMDEHLLRLQMLRVDAALDIVGKLYQDLINMDAVVQRKIIMRKD